MKKTTLLTALLAAACMLPLGAAQAQTAKAKSAAKQKTAQKAPAKRAAKKPAARSAKKGAKPAAAVVPAAVLEPLTEAEHATARLVHTGEIACELGARVSLTPDAANPGYFNVRMGKNSYHMRPVQSRTGAVRLEDPKARAFWLQLGNKSMLMDQKKGQRLADGCTSGEQRDFAAQMEKAPPQPSLFDGPVSGSQ